MLHSKRTVSDQDLLQQMYIIVEGRVVSGRRTRRCLQKARLTADLLL